VAGQEAIDMTDDRLARFRDQRTVLLTTFRRNGEGVGTPVSIVVDGDRAFVRSWTTAGKAKRLRRDPHARIAPSTARGRPTGDPIEAELHPAAPADADRARALLRRKHPVMHGVLVPLAHRLKRYETVHYEVRATA
jgi:PPOX class probable F420-dependent enzyme